MRIFGFLFIFLTKTIQDNFTPSKQQLPRLNSGSALNPGPAESQTRLSQLPVGKQQTENSDDKSLRYCHHFFVKLQKLHLILH